ncbi:MAG: glycogen/starch synthase [Balneola sp.]
MNIIHISAECYPIAKVGGLADVVGSLPKYLNEEGQHCEVVIPKYKNDWVVENDFEEVYSGEFNLKGESIEFSVQLLLSKGLGYPVYFIDIPGKFDRPGVYIDPLSGHPYWDEKERFISFQISVLEWLKVRKEKPEIIHCHDHHTGLVPFMTSQCNRYRELSQIPTLITVHNAEYQGRYEMENYQLLPAFNLDNIGLLEWDYMLNSLATGLKTAWQITTVSKNYMTELKQKSNGLESLFQHEEQKSTGIINGIDTKVWDPETDELLDHNFSYRSRKSGKAKNKKALCDRFGLDPKFPTIAFIGRLVKEKGADLLPELIANYLDEKKKVNFVLLGTGDPALHTVFKEMSNDYVGFFDATLEYNEKLAHQIYAGSDFILMPSRVEPCGLNQMFAMRYGTIPIVRAVGGLKDSVIDIEDSEGYGICFDSFSLKKAKKAVDRAIDLFGNETLFNQTRAKVMKLDFSWNRSAKEYIDVYTKLNEKVS